MSTSIVKKWDLTIESPTKVMRALEDFLHDDLYYSIVHMEKPELVRTAIEGTARFKGAIRGAKAYSKRSRIKVILGIIFVLLGIVTIFSAFFIPALVILIVGIILLAISKSLSSLIIHIKMEGESYRAGAGKETDKERAVARTERVGIISDARLTVYAWVEGKYGDSEIRLLKFNTDALISKVETELIPRFKLPEIK